ncbi:hypothetical protein [Curtobacterium sp. ME12]|uniref:hypothetical protein n=1 Tax=Curtobacterium sp. ME12 TaxID=2744253 RepID=UPI0015F395D6|nr:hypothetical protein [Curtobacterium sp. ME12]
MTIQQTAPTATTFDYRTVQIPKGKDALYQDTYRNFGWEPDGSSNRVPGTRRRSIGLRRDRTLRSVEVAELQQNAETALANIEALERSRSTAATILGYAFGLIGCIFLAFSVFATQDTVTTPSLFSDANAFTVFSVGAGGLFNWAIAPIAYHLIRNARTKKLRPRIDRQYDVVYGACEAASRRLNA